MRYKEVFGGVFLPITEAEEQKTMGFWAKKEEEYLKEYHPQVYKSMKREGILEQSLENTQIRAHLMWTNLMRQMVKTMKESGELSKELLLTNPKAYRGVIENLKHSMMEVVANEVIYTLD